MGSTKGGSGSRKYGRSGRKPSHQRYNAERRWETNKERKIEKEKRRQKKLADR